MTITPQDRAKLDRAIGAARQTIEADLERRAEGDYGLVVQTRFSQRRYLPSVRRRLVRAGSSSKSLSTCASADGDEAGPVGRLLREASFTLLNRLVAVRVAEAMDMLAPALADGPRSRGFRELLELYPLLRDGPSGGYWTFLRLAADELARDAPVLFDPRNPLLVLEPSPQALSELVDILSDPSLNAIWSQPDAFGWTYQFFNRPEERLAMREGSSAPRNSRELAVRNQFFTPRYVVDFLVHNTLGRRLVEAAQAKSWPASYRSSSRTAGPLAARSTLKTFAFSILPSAPDISCSGCYDVLKPPGSYAGSIAAEAAPHVVRALWGIDIDARCAQVAAAAIAIHARRRRPDGELPRLNIFTARALPDDPDAWAEALSDLDQSDERLARRIQEVLAQAPTLGPLLKVEEALEKEIQERRPQRRR